MLPINVSLYESCTPKGWTLGNIPKSFRTAFSQKKSGQPLSMPVTEFTSKIDWNGK